MESRILIGKIGWQETMLELNFKDINNNSKIIYLENLVGKIYKILPLTEEDESIPRIYMDRLINEMIAANNVFDEILIELIIKIYSINNKLTHKEIKSIIFNCISICNKLKEELYEEKYKEDIIKIKGE